MKARASLTAQTLVLVFLATLTSSFAFCSETSALVFVPGTGKTEFLAVGHPAAIKIHGEGPGPSGRIELASGQASGDFTFDLSELKTGIELRDHHMKEKYLETGKSDCTRKARLEITALKLPAGWKPGNKAALPFEGALHLHCQTKPVHGDLKLAQADGGNVRARSEFEIKLSDFAIDVPKYLGITVADTVRVSVETQGSTAK